MPEQPPNQLPTGEQVQAHLHELAEVLREAHHLEPEAQEALADLVEELVKRLRQLRSQAMKQLSWQTRPLTWRGPCTKSTTPPCCRPQSNGSNKPLCERRRTHRWLLVSRDGSWMPWPISASEQEERFLLPEAVPFLQRQRGRSSWRGC